MSFNYFQGCFQPAFCQTEKKGQGSVVQEDPVENEDEDIKVEDEAAAGGEGKAGVSSKVFKIPVIQLFVLFKKIFRTKTKRKK